jgi:hypothetical protein
VYKLNATVLATQSATMASTSRVYPNPAQGGRFRVVLGAAGPVQAEVVDVLGRPVYHFAGAGATELPLDLSGQAAGIYLLRLQAGGSASQHKLVVE